MADKVDMSLDDIIKMNRQNKRQQQFKNGSIRRSNQQQQQRQSNTNRSNSNNNSNFRQRRSNPYSRPATQTNTGNQWKHDLYDGNKPAHIMISNLHFRVSDNDIKELFKEFGQIKKAAVHYDKSGRSLGNAEVVFANKISARKAIEKYNDVQLDGRKMKITMVNDQPQQRIQQRTNIGNGNRINQNRPIQNGNRINRGAGNGPKGNRTNNANSKKPMPTKEQLDADLDSYLNKS